MSTKTVPPATNLTLIAVFAALISAFSLAPAIPVGALAVPITLQTLAVALTGLILGPWRAFAATALYLLVGFAGLPVFAGGASGLGSFAKPSIGYLLSFPVAALVCGWLARAFLRRFPDRQWLWLFAAGLAASILVIHPAGIVGMSVVANLPLMKAAVIDLAYWPGDIIKNAIAATVAVAVHRAFPELLGSAASRQERAECAPVR